LKAPLAPSRLRKIEKKNQKCLPQSGKEKGGKKFGGFAAKKKGTATSRLSFSDMTKIMMLLKMKIPFY
jgi:hypothetical protein